MCFTLTFATTWIKQFTILLIQLRITYVSEGLLRLFFKPMLLLLFPRRLPWFFTASSHMPMLLPLPPLLSMPPGPPHMPTPSTHCPPMEELPIDIPECCRHREERWVVTWLTTSVISKMITAWVLRNSLGLSAAGLSAAAAFPAEPKLEAFLPLKAQRRDPHSNWTCPSQVPAAGGSAAAVSWSVPAADDTIGSKDRASRNSCDRFISLYRQNWFLSWYRHKYTICI